MVRREACAVDLAATGGFPVVGISGGGRRIRGVGDRECFGWRRTRRGGEGSGSGRKKRERTGLGRYKMVTQRSRVHGSEPAHAAELHQRGFPFERFWNMIIRSLLFSAFPYFLSIFSEFFIFFKKENEMCIYVLI
jgi:hypothetical protein